MAKEMVTVRRLDLEGNLVGEEQHELMVRRPRGGTAYALLPGQTRRPLVADNPPTIETQPPRPVQPVRLAQVLRDQAEAAAVAGRRVRVVGMFDQ